MSWRIFGLILIMVSSSYLGPVSAQASRLAQDDPVAQCAAGVKLLLDGETDNARPLLEAGFAGRDTAEFVTPDDLGLCALVLGVVRHNTVTLAGPLRCICHCPRDLPSRGQSAGRGRALNNIGEVHTGQGRYAGGANGLQQALTIRRELDDRAGEGTTLDNIGGVLRRQGRYAEALAAFAAGAGDHGRGGQPGRRGRGAEQHRRGLP